AILRRTPVVSQVSVGIVTFNSAAQIGRCLASVHAQSCQPVEVVVWDNASADDSVAQARAQGARLLISERNLRFAAGAKEVIRRTAGDYLLLLNPDAYPAPDYLARLVAAADADPRVGSVTGKLVRSDPAAGPALIDSAGHVFYRNRSALNRGENEPDRGQFDESGEVFGVCAAAALYRRAMLDDLPVGAHHLGPPCFGSLPG